MHRIYLEKRCIVICPPDEPALSDPNAVQYCVGENPDVHSLTDMFESSPSLARIYIPIYSCRGHGGNLSPDLLGVRAGQCRRRACHQQEGRLSADQPQRAVGPSQRTSGGGGGHPYHRLARGSGRNGHIGACRRGPHMCHRPLLQAERPLASEAHMVVQHAV